MTAGRRPREARGAGGPPAPPAAAAPLGPERADDVPTVPTAAPPHAAGAAFALERATVRYPSGAALDGATHAVAPGEAVALVGPSGAGKTTLLRLLNASVRPTGGTVRVDGEDLAELSAPGLREARARIGFVHQDLALVPNVRVSTNVLCGRLGRQSFLGALRSLALPRREELELAAALLTRVGIGEKLFERTDALSGGQRQRVAIARALYQQPSALLADEPVSSVDPARARDTVGLLAEVSRERGLTLVVSLHDFELARAFFPRLVGLRGGRVVFDLPAGEVDGRRAAELYRLDGYAP